ncbi:MAG: AMP-binding protein [Actinobacteria bacterium]|nr:AMP-binding protein [Actinomycetota bacterium]
MDQAELTVAGLLARRSGDVHPGLRAGDDFWSWGEVVAESARRAAALKALKGDGPPHVGVLLDNVPELLFWLGGAALAGAAIVGINPTRRGTELAADVAHTNCQLIVTDANGAATLDGLELGVPADRILDIGSTAYKELIANHAGASVPDITDIDEATLLLLLFTSGTTGAPKAVRCTQGRLASIAERVEALYGVNRDDVCYAPMPLFHGNALMALWAPAVRTGAMVALTPKFSASGFLDDVRRYHATYFTYVGKALTYVLGTEPKPDDAHNTLQRGFGNEASDLDIERFQQRFGCKIIEGYGSSEGGAVIVRVPDMPAGSLGVGAPGVCVVNPDTMAECPPATFDDNGRLLNAEQATGEIVNTQGLERFEGYYRNDDAFAQRSRNGWYWSGDLAYRDDKGFFWFAGRSADWLRVDGENFAAAPVERIVSRFEGVAAVAVYAVPDALSGDQVMAAIELTASACFDGDAFGAFIATQPDLGTKWAPRFVRIVDHMPLTGSNKVVKTGVRAHAWVTDDAVFWRAGRGDTVYRKMTDADRAELHADFVDHGRVALVPNP